MRAPVGRWAVLLGALGAAWGGWLLLRAGGGPSDSGEGIAEHGPRQDSVGPQLEVGTRRAAQGQGSAQGRFQIRGRVLDERGLPVVTRVVARRQAPTPATGGSAGGSSERSAEIARAFLGPEDSHASAIEHEAQSDAEGAFLLVVGWRTAYDVSAEPEAPQVGTSIACDLSETSLCDPLLLRVLAGSAVRGRVLDERDRGLSARLRAEVETAHEKWVSSALETDSGTGGFVVPAVPAGRLTLEVFVADGLVVSRRGLIAPLTEELVIRLPASGALLSGTVRDTGGRPVPGAHIVAVVNDARSPSASADTAPALGSLAGARYLALTDESGAYVVTGPYDGRLDLLEVAAPGFLPHVSSAPRAPWSGLLLSAQAPPRLDVTLVAGGAVEGHVREASTGNPLPGAEIQLAPIAVDMRLTRPDVLRAVSDGKGRYRIEGVPIGRSVVFVTHPSHHERTLAAIPRDEAGSAEIDSALAHYVPAALCVFVEREGQRVTRDIELLPGVPVSGLVLGPDGAPAADAEVLALGDDLSSLRWRWDLEHAPRQRVLAVSGGDGRFEVGGLSPGSNHVLLARKAGFASALSESLMLASVAPRHDVTLRLARGTTLVGRVLDLRGVPLDHAWVDAWTDAPEGLGASNAYVETGADGAFRLEGLPVGKLNVTAGAIDHGNVEQEVEVRRAGEVLPPLELRLDQRVRVEGVLVDEGGRPLAGKTLSARSGDDGDYEYALSRTDGTFSIDGLVPGPVTLFGRAEGHYGAALLMQAEAPATGLRVSWKEPTRTVIEGTVLDDQARPVPLCRVLVRASRGDRLVDEQRGRPTTVVNGAFRRAVEGAAPFQIVVSAPQDTEGRALNLRSRTVDLSQAPTEPTVIALEPGLSLAGLVLDADGAPVAGVVFTAGLITAVSAADGSFFLAGLDSESVWLEVEPPRGHLKPEPRWVRTGSSDVVVRLGRGATLSGTVLDPDGRPIRGGWVEARWEPVPDTSSGEAQVSIADNGRFAFRGLPPQARLTLRAETWTDEDEPAFGPGIVDGVLPGQGDLVIRLPKGATVAGQVVEADGSPARGAIVWVRQGPGSSYSSGEDLGDDGHFELRGLPPGPVQLSFESDDLLGSTELTVNAPATGVRVVLPRRTPIEGRIGGAGNEAGWRVWAWRSTDSDERSAPVEVGADGRFALRAISEAGPWMLGASSDDGHYAMAGPVRGGATNVELEARQGGVIEGRVRTASGKPPGAGSQVDLQGPGWDQSARIGAEGAYRFDGLPPGLYTLSVVAREGSVAVVEEATGGTRRVDLVLEAPK